MEGGLDIAYLGAVPTKSRSRSGVEQAALLLLVKLQKTQSRTVDHVLIQNGGNVHDKLERGKILLELRARNRDCTRGEVGCHAPNAMFPPAHSRTSYSMIHLVV
jgi:hypothetical protein